MRPVAAASRDRLRLCVVFVKAEADYGGTLRASKPARSSGGYLTSVSECMLRAASMEHAVTECATFNDHTLTEGLLCCFTCSPV